MVSGSVFKALHSLLWTKISCAQLVTKFLFKFTRTLKSQDVSKLWKPIKTFQIQSEFGPDPVEHSKPQAAYFNIYSLGGKRDQYYTTCTQIWRVLLGFHNKQTSQTYYHTIGILL